MSVIYCSYCGKHIDTDFDLDHFVIDDDLEHNFEYCIEEEEKDNKD